MLAFNQVNYSLEVCEGGLIKEITENKTGSVGKKIFFCCELLLVFLLSICILRKKMGVYSFAAIFLIAHLMLLHETLGEDSASKSRLRGLDRRYQFARFPLSEILMEGKEDSLGKRQEQFDDYGHMRFGKRGEESDDYGHMRFGKRD